MADQVVNAWKGWWLLDAFDYPGGAAPTICDVEGSASERRDIDNTSRTLQLHIDVQQAPLYDPVDNGVSPNVKPLRRLPVHQQFLECQWYDCGKWFVARGALSDSLRVVDGATVHVQHFADAAARVVGPSLCDGNIADVARHKPSMKAVHIVGPDAVGDAERATIAESFVCPMTLHLQIGDDMVASSLRINLDWKRLHHGVGTSQRVAVRCTALPLIICVRVRSVEPHKDVPPLLGIKTGASDVGRDVWQSSGECGPSCTDELRMAAAVCDLTAQHQPQLFAMLPVDLCSTSDALLSIGSDSQFHSVSRTDFGANIRHARYCAHYTASEEGVRVGIGMDRRSYALMKDEPPRKRYLLPVNDWVLAQLQLHHVRCCLADLTLVPRTAATDGDSTQRDNALKWCSVDHTNCFVRCEGHYTSLRMASLGLIKTNFCDSAGNV